MSRVFESIAVCIFFIVASGCSPKELPANEYVSWVKDYTNGLHQKRELKGITIDVQYKPIEFILLNEGIKDKILYEKRKKELEDMEYFDVKIYSSKGDFIKTDASSVEDYQQRLYYFSFDFQKDIFLSEGNQNEPCELFHFERSYNLTSTKSFLLGFRKSNRDYKDKTLIIESGPLGLGILKIKFNKEDFSGTPFLRL